MSSTLLNVFYPPGGVTIEKQRIENIKTTTQDGVFTGDVFLKEKETSNGLPADKIVIFHYYKDDGSLDMRAVSAKCPHQGADITHDPLKKDGNVYCSLHKRPICIYSEYNQAYVVSKQGENYFLGQ